MDNYTEEGGLYPEDQAYKLTQIAIVNFLLSHVHTPIAASNATENI